MIIDSVVVILCLKLFFGRILDVTLGTLRTIFTVKGKSFIAAACGFTEVLVWFLIVREALKTDVNGLPLAVAYAAGFGIGTLTGGLLARRFIPLDIEVQVVTSRQDDEMIRKIQDEGFAVTVINVNKTQFGDDKYMLIAEIRNSHLQEFKSLVYALDPQAFIMAQETKYVYNGFFKKK